MISKQINTCKRYMPVPLSFLINAANTFACDIYVECDENPVNVKSYDEMLRNLKIHTNPLMFIFNGIDEQAAQTKFERIFQE